jgi:acid phosphatase type 7
MRSSSAATRVLAAAAGLAVVLSACTTGSPPSPGPSSAAPLSSPAASTPSSPRPVEDAVLLAAGDIASCTSSGDEATARLLDRLPGTVAVLGDSAYPDGSTSDFARCYEPSWGRHKSRTRPAVGNHEYQTSRAAGYFDYFGPSAGDRRRGYYSYDLGSWHVVVLNSICWVVGCVAGSAQERWLRADLRASPRTCTLAYWHHPLFTSGANHGPATVMRPLFRTLHEHGVDVVLAGHNHHYERFAPQDPNGRSDPARGIRSFVVGTGGASHYGFGAIAANSEARSSDTFGVLRLALGDGRYDWRFVPVAGSSYSDRGTGRCH